MRIGGRFVALSLLVYVLGGRALPLAGAEPRQRAGRDRPPPSRVGASDDV